MKKKAAPPLHLFGKVASRAGSKLNQDIAHVKGLKDHEKTALPKILLYPSLSTVLLRTVAWTDKAKIRSLRVAVVISKLFVIVLWKTVVEERTIHRDQSAALDINTDKEKQEFLAGWENKMPSGHAPPTRILRVTVTIVEGCQA